MKIPHFSTTNVRIFFINLNSSWFGNTLLLGSASLELKYLNSLTITSYKFSLCFIFRFCFPQSLLYGFKYNLLLWKCTLLLKKKNHIISMFISRKNEYLIGCVRTTNSGHTRWIQVKSYFNKSQCTKHLGIMMAGKTAMLNNIMVFSL